MRLFLHDGTATNEKFVRIDTTKQNIKFLYFDVNPFLKREEVYDKNDIKKIQSTLKNIQMNYTELTPELIERISLILKLVESLIDETILNNLTLRTYIEGSLLHINSLYEKIQKIKSY